MSKITIYLADLTHTATVISSNVHPFGVGLLAAYLLEKRDDVEVELFKYPDDLSRALQKKIPHILGFANYSWNMNLSYAFTQVIKKRSPETIVVYGGPNYGLMDSELDEFWKRYPLVDFHFVREGEAAFTEFVDRAASVDFSLEKLNALELRNCHYMREGELHQAEMMPRLDIAEIPSPYLMGLMDKFFDPILMPMLHTTRGCPFKCTFCADGADYYLKVKHKQDLREELEYIAKKIVGRKELFITDANFGMFKQDIEKAKDIAAIQDKYGFPDYIHVASGKNQKERVLEVAEMINGAMRSVSIALQSTDEEVLKNVKRDNIKIDSLQGIGDKTKAANNDSYTEVILALPGDSLERHINTLRDVVNADMGIVRMYQLILLPQTELNEPETRAKFEMQTRFRIMPRSYGVYDCAGEKMLAVEAEEICVGNNSMSFEDYLQCRELNLTIEVFHNGRTFQELKGICQYLDISWFDFLLRFHEKRYDYHPDLKDLYQSFRDGNEKGIWNDYESLIDEFSANVEDIMGNTEGTNEMSRAKSIAFFKLMDVLHDALYQEMKAVWKEQRPEDDADLYLTQLCEFSRLRKRDIINRELNYELSVDFDLKAIAEQGYAVAPADYKLESPLSYRINHTEEQKKLIDDYIIEYGDSIDGLSRIIMFRVHYKRIFREFVTAA